MEGREAFSTSAVSLIGARMKLRRIGSTGDARRWTVVVLMFTAFLTMFGSGFPSTAFAASEGPGLRIGGVFVGAFITSNNSSNAFCVEPDGDNPSSEIPATVMSEFRGYLMQSTGHWVAPYSDEFGLRRMNYITSTYGTLGAGGDWQNDQAAAVALAVWTIRGEQDGVVASWVAGLKSQAPGNVQRLIDSFLTEAAAAVVPVAPSAPTEPQVTWSDELHASVEIPRGYTEFHVESGGRLTGTAPDGTTYSASAKETALDPTKTYSLAIESLPAETSSRTHRLKVSAHWSQSVAQWPSRVWGYQPSADAADQLLIAGGGSVSVADEGVWRDTIRPRAGSEFAPVVTTEVTSRILGTDEPYVDRVSFGLDANSGAWPQYWDNGAWHPRAVRATGTLYGPLKQRPEEQTRVPEDSDVPIAGTAVVEAVNGPTTYDVQIDKPEETVAGFYTWVWNIDGLDQGSQMQTGDAEDWHLASDYQFQDAYGQAGETQLRPLEFSIRTALKERTLAAGGSTTDLITIDHGAGEWLTVEGKDAPITFRATIYEVDGTPKRAEDPPPSARIRATERVTVTNDDDPIVVPVSVPLARTGNVTVQVCVLAEDQEDQVRDLVVETCDDWGIPEESAHIELPKVTTMAQEEGVVGGTIRDEAKIDGLVPEGATLGFTAYLRPEVGEPKYSEEWEPLRNTSGETVRWTEEELSGLSSQERCLAQPVATTPRATVEGPGTYVSPAVVARSEGTVRWVEDLEVSRGKQESPLEIHRGRCGAVNETTRIVNQVAGLSTTGGASWGALGGATAALLTGGGFLLFVRGRLKASRLGWKDGGGN